MRVMRVSEFEQWLQKSGGHDFTLDTGNIAGVSCGMTLTQRYTAAVVSRFYDRILFRNPKGALLLSGVKEVHMIGESDGTGTVIDIICETKEGNEERNWVSWTFLVD